MNGIEEFHAKIDAGRGARLARLSDAQAIDRMIMGFAGAAIPTAELAARFRDQIGREPPSEEVLDVAVETFHERHAEVWLEVSADWLPHELAMDAAISGDQDEISLDLAKVRMLQNGLANIAALLRGAPG